MSAARLAADDRLLVIDALGRASHSVDALALDEMAGAFTGDATWQVGAGPAVVGPAAIRDALAAELPAGAAARRHLRNTVFDGVDHDGAVLTRSYYLMTVVADGGQPSIVATGVYEDRLVRSGDRWLVAARVAHPDGEDRPGPRA